MPMMMFVVIDALAQIIKDIAIWCALIGWVILLVRELCNKRKPVDSYEISFGYIMSVCFDWMGDITGDQ